MISETLIRTKNLTKVFQLPSGDIRAVDSVNLEVHRGELVGIYGVSGSGKTTLLNLLGLLEQPSEGEIIFEKKNLVGIKRSEQIEYRRTAFGYLHQSFGLLNDFTAVENVEMPLLVHDISAETRSERVMSKLAEIGLEDKYDAFPSQLSGGQQQRVALARALITSPKIILTDEPTGALDTITGRKIVSLLKNIAHDSATNKPAVIMVTHDTSYRHMFDRIYRMEDGRINLEDN